MREQQIIDNTIAFVQQTLKGAEGGHDWWHIQRVWKTALTIAKSEAVNGFVVQLGALLHDIADSKFNNGDESLGAKVAEDFLQNQGLQADVIQHIIQIINNVSYKGGRVERTFSSKELDVIQDADRLDALGAIGIARTFNYGGFKNRELYNPEIAPDLNMTKKEYKNSTAPTLNHFYEKLLLLKDRMNTMTGKAMAEQRHIFIENYLEQFYAEWEGER